MADGKITGTLIYNEGWESGPLAGPGYFLALKFSSEDWADYDSIMVGLDPSIETGLVEVKNDPDKNGVFKISARDTQKFIVQTRVGSITTRTQYDLSELVYQEPAVEGMLVLPDPSTPAIGGIVGDYQTNMLISNGSESGEYIITGSLLYDQADETYPFHMFLISKDHVDAFDDVSLKGSLHGMVETIPNAIVNYGGENGQPAWCVNTHLKPQVITTIRQCDDVWFSVTYNGTTQKYSIKNIVFVEPNS